MYMYSTSKRSAQDSTALPAEQKEELSLSGWTLHEVSGLEGQPQVYGQQQENCPRPRPRFEIWMSWWVTVPELPSQAWEGEYQTDIDY